MSIRTGRVIQIYTSGGAPVCDVADEVGGSVFVACPILMLGGATSEQHLYMPPVVTGSRVVFAPYYGTASTAVVLGAVATSAVGAKFQDEVQDDPSADYPAQKVSRTAAVCRNGGATLVITNDGRIVLDAVTSKKPVNIQLAAQPLRISQDGEEPTERTLLAGPSRAVLDDIIFRVNTLTDALQSLAVVAAAAATLPVVGSVVVSALAPVVVLSTYPMEATSDALTADAILLSDRPYAPDLA